MFLFSKPSTMVTADEALPGRDETMSVPAAHEVLGNPIAPPFPEGLEQAVVGMGCFWGAERVFWENHDPTQGDRQGNDVGTQYRSAIYWLDEAQRAAAEASRDVYAAQLKASGYGEITTEIAKAGPFYYAEEYHQQYLQKNPGGYCGLGGTGVSCPVGLARVASQDQ